MDPVSRPRLKVCCILDRSEAALAVRAGAAALGLVSAMPSGPGVADDAAIAEVAAATPPGVASFLLTSRQDVDGIVDQQRRLRPSVLQLVDHLAPEQRRALREALPGIGIVQVVHVCDEGALEEAREAARYADAVLLDSGDPRKAVKELGGTGRSHDWRISRRIRESLDVPLWLAGGLTPDNVARAIAEVGPFGLDVCSGVRTAGRLDPGKLQAFTRAAGS